MRSDMRMPWSDDYNDIRRKIRALLQTPGFKERIPKLVGKFDVAKQCLRPGH